MGAVFGVVGKVAPEELDEMARRLAHRGTQSTWNQVAENVHLGQIGPVARKPHSDSRLSVVIDAPESLDGAAYDRILEVFLQSRRADEIDRNLRFPFTL